MIIDRQEDVTPAVLVAMSKGNARLREVISTLVAHLHAFAREGPAHRGGMGIRHRLS